MSNKQALKKLLYALHAMAGFDHDYCPTCNASWGRKVGTLHEPGCALMHVAKALGCPEVFDEIVESG